jgi:O-succinylbenzoic acid--CoA ligase
VGTIELTEEYWACPLPDLRLNPGVAHPGEGLEEAIDREPRLRGHILFATSGSSGRSKVVCLEKSGFLTAARWVNQHLKCDSRDCWLLALPQFHVGGFGLTVRAWAAGGRLHVLPGRWNARRFQEEARDYEATVTSLVPAQLHDLVRAGLRSPRSLRHAVIGGGRLEPGLRERGVELGWPIVESYGMTETCAQLATQRSSAEPAGWLKVISGWEVRVNAGTIWVRGEPLLSGYLERAADGRWNLRAACDEAGWFETGDLGEIDPIGRLRVQGRAGRVVKVLGELVDLDRLDLLLSENCPERDSVIEPVEDPRAGWRLILVSERPEHEAWRLAEVFNARVAPFEQIGEVRTVSKLRRSELGKRLPQTEPDSTA